MCDPTVPPPAPSLRQSDTLRSKNRFRDCPMRKTKPATGGFPLTQADVARPKAAATAPSPAETARHAYEFYRAMVHRRFDLREYSLPPTYGSEVWQRVADACAARSVDAPRFIAFALTPRQATPRSPEPTNLVTDRLLDEYTHYLAHRPTVLATDFRTDRDQALYQVRNLLDPDDTDREPPPSAIRALAAVLACPGVDLSPLYRYVAARDLLAQDGRPALRRVVTRYEVPARLQFQADAPAYVATWGGLPFWPADFTVEASDLWFAGYLSRWFRDGRGR